MINKNEIPKIVKNQNISNKETLSISDPNQTERPNINAYQFMKPNHWENKNKSIKIKETNKTQF